MLAGGARADQGSLKGFVGKFNVEGILNLVTQNTSLPLFPT